MKKILTVIACFVMVLAGGLALAGCNDDEIIPKDAIYISNSNELIQAVNQQEDGQFWVLEKGIYDLNPESVTINYLDQTGWYLPIVKDNITIYGKDNVVLMSSHETPNGALATQNLITIVGDDVTLKNLDVICKKEVNKVVLIAGKNATIEDVDFKAPNGSNFAGSIYLNQTEVQGEGVGDVGTLTLKDVDLEKGRITASGAYSGKIVFDDVDIDWTNIEADLIEGFYPMLNFNVEGKNFTFEGAKTVEVKMSSTEMGNFYTVAQQNLIEGVKLIDVAN